MYYLKGQISALEKFNLLYGQHIMISCPIFTKDLLMELKNFNKLQPTHEQIQLFEKAGHEILATDLQIEFIITENIIRQKLMRLFVSNIAKIHIFMPKEFRFTIANYRRNMEQETILEIANQINDLFSHMASEINIENNDLVFTIDPDIFAYETKADETLEYN